MNNLLNASQAARLRGVSPTAVINWIEKKYLPARKLGNMWLIKRSDLNAAQPNPAGRPWGRERV